MLKNATKLSTDWLYNNMAFSLEGEDNFVREKVSDYYITICGFIQDNHFLKLSAKAVEEYIAEGSYKHTASDDAVITISTDLDSETRRYLFLRSQAKQLIYDFNNGRASMIRGERGTVCPDTITILKQLGLYKPSRYFD